LAPVLFPLGDIAKREVRAIAQARRHPTHAKKDSTGICFIGERPFRDFLARYLPRTPGPVVTPDGAVVGRIRASRTTRSASARGWASAGRAMAATRRGSSPARSVQRNALVAVQGHEHPLLYRRNVEAIDMHWISGTRLRCRAAWRQDAVPDARCGSAR
jgi:tRNA-specific 2-thiouridylase